METSIPSLLWQSYIAPLYYLEVSLPLIAMSLLSIGIGRRGLSRLSWRSWCVLLSAYLVPFLIASWGALMQYSGPVQGPVWPAFVILGLVLSLVFFCLLSIWRLAGSRLVTIGVLLPSVWFSLLTAFTACMAVTNNWI